MSAGRMWNPRLHVRPSGGPSDEHLNDLLRERLSRSVAEDSRSAQMPRTSRSNSSKSWKLASFFSAFSSLIEHGTRALKRLVNELGEHLGELKLNQAECQRVQAQLATLNAQLTDSPNPVIVREAGRTIRNLTQGAISSVIATAAQPTVWASIQAISRTSNGDDEPPSQAVRHREGVNCLYLPA
jgi:hypothetical protein